MEEPGLSPLKRFHALTLLQDQMEARTLSHEEPHKRLLHRVYPRKPFLREILNASSAAAEILFGSGVFERSPNEAEAPWAIIAPTGERLEEGINAAWKGAMLGVMLYQVGPTLVVKLLKASQADVDLRRSDPHLADCRLNPLYILAKLFSDVRGDKLALELTEKVTRLIRDTNLRLVRASKGYDAYKVLRDRLLLTFSEGPFGEAVYKNEGPRARGWVIHWTSSVLRACGWNDANLEKKVGDRFDPLHKKHAKKGPRLEKDFPEILANWLYFLRLLELLPTD